MDGMGSEIQQIKAQLNIHPIIYASYVHGEMLLRDKGANSGAGINDRGITPMETEEGYPLRAPEIQESISSN
jgi:hypothetical protein